MDQNLKRLKMIQRLYMSMPGAPEVPWVDGARAWGEVEHTEHWVFCENIVDMILSKDSCDVLQGNKVMALKTLPYYLTKQVENDAEEVITLATVPNNLADVAVYKSRLEAIATKMRQLQKLIEAEGQEQAAKQLYRTKAQKITASQDNLEVDNSALVSTIAEDGAYVQAWLWVPKDAEKS